MKIAVTGANGYIGSAVVEKLLECNHQVVALVRKKTTYLPDKVEQIIIGDLSKPDLINALECAFQSIDGFDALIHTAALAHNDDKNPDYLALVKQVNVEATMVLAQLADRFNVVRFIFLSSIGVNGGMSTAPFTENDAPNPHNYYSKCKYKAEQGLLSLSAKVKMEVVIIRPPLVYSHHAPGNFARLVNLVESGFPLPLGCIKNKRSLLALDNLVDFLVFCSDQKKTPLAKNQIFLVADGEDISTTELIEKIAFSLNKKSRLIPVNSKIFFIFLKLIGRHKLYTQLFDSLQIDASKAINLLGWPPKVTIYQQLNKTKM